MKHDVKPGLQYDARNTMPTLHWNSLFVRDPIPLMLLLVQVKPPHENDSSAWKLIADCQGALDQTPGERE